MLTLTPVPSVKGLFFTNPSIVELSSSLSLKFSFQISNGANGTISAGDFFKDDCNTTVNNMLKSSTGGAGGTPMFYSSLQFTEFDKDWN